MEKEDNANVTRPYSMGTYGTSSCWIGTTSYVPAIQIRWQSSDLSILETLPMSPGLKHTPSTTALPSTTAASASGSKASTTSGLIGQTGDAAVDSSLGTGAKAGVGIGAALGVLALLAIGFLIWRRRHRYNAVQNTSDETDNDAPEMISANWNEGHDLPVVVQDKKGEIRALSIA